MAGYDGYSMSNNARAAYEYGEKPYSKWTKSEIIAELTRGGLDDLSVNIIKKMSSETVKDWFLCKTSWHHTSGWYNETDFYSVDDSHALLLGHDGLSDLLETDKKKRAEKKSQKKSEPKTIRARVTYDYWTGTRKHPKKNTVTEEITYIEGDKMVTTSNGNKRMTSLRNIEIMENS